MYKVTRPEMYAVLSIAIFLQFTAARYLAVGGVKPDLVIMCVIFFGLYFGSPKGFEAGLVAGFFQDVFVLDYFGMNTFLYGATGLYAGVISAQFSKESPAARFFLVAIIYALSMTLHFALAALLSPYHALEFTEYLTGTVLPGSLLTALFSAAAFPKLMSMFRIKGREEFI